MKIKCAATLAALVLCGCGMTVNVVTSPQTYPLASSPRRPSSC